ncbi:uncharacterized protein L203_103936 [Cryptococcus depauperatus CBS 7841]|uniref:Uncharacterized protein n=1 Tax=Cryptococcus depauperatus CBS 7841 TaxID=1295531 RepID=A0AAJ8M230_9TREE
MFTPVKIEGLSFLSLRGFEWRPGIKKGDATSTLRIESAQWAWAGLDGGLAGLIILKIGGVHIRVKKGTLRVAGNALEEKHKQSFDVLSSCQNHYVSSFLTMLINHYTWFICIFSIQVTDCQIFFDELDGFSITAKELGLRAEVDFEDDDMNGIAAISPPYGIGNETLHDNRKPKNDMLFMASRQDMPTPLTRSTLAETTSCLSESPSDTHIEPSRLHQKISRFLSRIQKQISLSQSRVYASTHKIWMRASGQTCGSICFRAYLDTVKCVIDTNAASSSLKSEASDQEISKMSIHKTLARETSSVYENQSQVLVALDERSNSTLSVAFGPRKALLSQNTLGTVFEMSKIMIDIGALRQFNKLLKTIRGSSKEIEVQHEPTFGGFTFSNARFASKIMGSVKLSFQGLTLLHHLTKPMITPPTNDFPSADNHYSDLSSYSTNGDYVVTLGLSEISCVLKATSSSNNDFARTVFGKNPCPLSSVRGTAFELAVARIVMQCATAHEEQDQFRLLTVNSTELAGFSSWRPEWSRRESLFASDPNLALVIGESRIANMNLTGDTQLLQNLAAAWKSANPYQEEIRSPPEARVETSLTWLPPQICLSLENGPITITLINRILPDPITLDMNLDGFRLNCRAAFSDIIARHRNKAESKAAFQEEQERIMSQKVDIALNVINDPKLSKLCSRNLITKKAALRDGLSLSMNGEVVLSVEPIRVRMTLPGCTIHDMVEVGKFHTTAVCNILGKHTIKASGQETASLLWNSAFSRINADIQHGIVFDLWQPKILETLIALGDARRSSNAKDSILKDKRRSIFGLLPSGLSVHFSLGLINVLLGVKDPNPECYLKLIRGLWLQAVMNMEYAYYKDKYQAIPWRHDVTAPRRGKLCLPDDVETRALALVSTDTSAENLAALVAINTEEICSRPAHNRERFARSKCYKRDVLSNAIKKSELDENSVSQDSQEANLHQSTAIETPFVHTSYLHVANSNFAARPSVKIPVFSTSVIIHQPKEGIDGTVYKIAMKMNSPAIITDLSYSYCILLVSLSIKGLVDAWKESDGAKGCPPSLHDQLYDINVNLSNITIHWVFPLCDQIFICASGVTIFKHSPKGLVIVGDKTLFYVPSPKMAGQWEELCQIRQFTVALSDPHTPLVLSTRIKSIRISIPFSYKFSSLVLNTNVTIKSLKLLSKNILGNIPYSTILKLLAEEPKCVPSLIFNVGYVSLEAKDDPIETSLNLIWRVGMAEQAKRNALEDNFAKKLQLISVPEGSPGFREENIVDGTKVPSLTKTHTIGPEKARWALDLVMSQSWARRIRAAKHEQARKETLILKRLGGSGINIKLPIRLTSYSGTTPLFRATLHDLHMMITDPSMSRAEIINYMGTISEPFNHDIRFSLMIPLKIEWTMSAVKCMLRDYPVPLVRVQHVEDSKQKPTFDIKTTLIIAEELAGEDSIVYIPIEAIPGGCGHKDAAPLLLQIYKTIMPVKTYAEPRITINSTDSTGLAWGNSYQPAIQDLTKVFESLTHPPIDPSSKLGFWDKFRLVLHWKTTVHFSGPCDLYLKGSFDPYSVSGNGSGFCFTWEGNTKLLINLPNSDRETIQIMADELIVAIPDSFHDGAAIGGSRNHRHSFKSHLNDEEMPFLVDRVLSEQRYTKICARFVNGVKVGFGFIFERTCRPWTCVGGCGNTNNLFHRRCRLFDFVPHQNVALKSPEALRKLENFLGRTPDSYEGFRSDFIHFSVSLVAGEQLPSIEEALEKVSSLHFAPKASHHFLKWWRLFDHQMSLPIRLGKLFPNSPQPSKKFGRSLGTIKYRFNIKPVYISHTYCQVDRNHIANGKLESLGIKAQVGCFRADAHQRAQEKIERHEKLGRSTVVIHKPFYAADILGDDLIIKGLRAHFFEKARSATISSDRFSQVSSLPSSLKDWYNYLDHVDVDQKPADKDPLIEFVDFGDSPHLYYSKRVKTRAAHLVESNINTNVALGIERSKFGYEPTHHCYLGMAKGVKDVQQSLAFKRIDEIRKAIQSYPRTGFVKGEYSKLLRVKLLLENHIRELEGETRRVSNDTSDHSNSNSVLRDDPDSQSSFEDIIHIHNPRLFLTNSSRNIGFKYLYMMADRKKEEYFMSNAYLRSMLNSFQQRIYRRQHGIDKDDITVDEESAPQMLNGLLHWLIERQPSQGLHYFDDAVEQITPQPHLGLPRTCDVKPKTHVSIFKPQIALRSESDIDAIVLLSVEEASFKQFRVVDKNALDDVMADVLNRNYIRLQGLQAFYPSAEALRREKTQAGILRGFDFIPLEIFLDVKSEATDYDRVLQKSNIFIAIDKFNHIRMPQGLEWPENAVDEYGEPIKHLKIHQDLTSVIAPRLTVTADSRNFEALYVIVTDLLLYQDPGHKGRSETVDDFTRTFDAADRDVGRLVSDVNSLQVHMRGLLDLQQGYEANFEILDDTGKEELFKIRSELQMGYENMYTVNALIRATLAKDDARAAMKTASKLDVRVGAVNWHMLRDARLEIMAKADINGVMFSMLNNKNGTMDNAMAIGDLKALNGKANALYPEVIVRDESNKKKTKKPFAAICWSTSPSIGGIAIFSEFNIEFVDIRFKLEEKLGLEVMDYFFTDRLRRRQISSTIVKPMTTGTTESSTPNSTILEGSEMTEIENLSDQQITLPFNKSFALSRLPSQLSLASQNDRNVAFLKRSEDTQEMRLRASTNKMFGTIRLHGLALNLSFKSDETRKHGTFSMPDCVDFRFRTPEMVYTNKVWSMEDIFEHIKRDVKSSAWSQSGDIISQLFKKTSIFRPKDRLKHAASVVTMSERGHKGKIPQSKSLVAPSGTHHTLQRAHHPLDKSESTQTNSRIIREGDNEDSQFVNLSENDGIITNRQINNDDNAGDRQPLASDEDPSHDEDDLSIEIQEIRKSSWILSVSVIRMWALQYEEAANCAMLHIIQAGVIPTQFLPRLLCQNPTNPLDGFQITIWLPSGIFNITG